MNLYTSDYTTFDRFNEQIRSNPDDAQVVDDYDTIRGYIREASAFFSGERVTNRVFVPYTFTHEMEYLGKNFDATGRFLWLPDDLLSITTLTNTDGTTIDSSDYRLRYQYLSPNQQIEIDANARLGTFSSDNFINRYELEGVWGYHRSYSNNAWQSISQTVTVDDATETTITFSAIPSTLERLHYIKVEDEMMQITGVTTGAEVDVTRGVNGTTAASHAGGTAVTYWQVEPDVQLAVTRLATGLYRTRHNAGQQLRFMDGTVLVEGDEKSMTRIASYLRRHPRVVGV